MLQYTQVIENRPKPWI